MPVCWRKQTWMKSNAYYRMATEKQQNNETKGKQTIL